MKQNEQTKKGRIITTNIKFIKNMNKQENRENKHLHT